jgi:REP element-mobilizing transposase RayT
LYIGDRESKVAQVASYTQLYVHVLWSTWDRLPLVTPALEASIYAALAAKCAALECKALAIGGIADHVHVLAHLAPTIAVARLVGEMKGSSAHLATHELQPGEFFKWQRSYRAFTVSQSVLPRVRAYILAQKEHHRAGTLTDAIEPIHDEL